MRSEGSAKKEEKPRRFQAIRGVRDILPPETALWNRVEQTAHQVFRTFGFGEIRPPIFEATELFARSVGDDTDIVSKEMYSVAQDDLLKLAQTRDVLVRRSPHVGLLSDVETYERLVGRWLDDVSQKTSAGQLIDTAENRKVLKSMPAYLGEMKHAAALFFRGEDALGTERFQQSLIAVKTALQAFQFEAPPTAQPEAEASLRPEATASVCRAYIEHNMQQWPQPVKLYYIGPMFRRERPQKGRYRQFYQIGAEVLEAVRPDAAKDAPKELAKDAAVDSEVIEMLMAFFDGIGLQGTELSINSIGHAADNCRRGYVAKLREELTKVKDQLGADSQRRIETNPLRVLDSKLEHEQVIIAKLPHIADHLCDDCKAHYAELKRQLDLRGVQYVENWRLVRGLDYYMRTTFEITARGLGSQDAVCGGGRYDGLVELLGGPPTKGIGFAIGEDRVILSLQEQRAQAAVATHEPISIYIAWLGEKAYATALRGAKTLRASGFRVEMPATELKFGKALERASKLNSRYALILGDDEISTGHWTLKTLADGSQQKLTEAALLEYLRAHAKS